MHHRGPGLGRIDRRLGDLLGGHRHVRAAADRLAGARDGACDEGVPVHGLVPRCPPTRDCTARGPLATLRLGRPTPRRAAGNERGRPWITEPHWSVPGRIISRRQPILGGASAARHGGVPGRRGSVRRRRRTGPAAGRRPTAGGTARPRRRRHDAAAADPPQPAARCGSASSGARTTSSTASSSWPRPTRPAWSPAGSRSSATTPSSTWCTSNALAEEIEASAADLYVIRLKEGIEFHNGQPVTADDVIYSFQRRLDPDLALAPALAALLDAGRRDEGRRPHCAGAAQAAGRHLPQRPGRVHGHGRAGRLHPRGPGQVGTGPFVLQSFTAGAESVHKKNPNYWDSGKPYLDEVQIIDFADAAALVNALSSGRGRRHRRRARSRRSPPSRRTPTWRCSSPRPAAGCRSPWLSTRSRSPIPKVRQAMRLIVDRKQMVERVLSGHGRVANDMYGVFDACYPDDFPQRDAGHRAGQAAAAPRPGRKDL